MITVKNVGKRECTIKYGVNGTNELFKDVEMINGPDKVLTIHDMCTWKGNPVEELDNLFDIIVYAFKIMNDGDRYIFKNEYNWDVYFSTNQIKFVHNLLEIIVKDGGEYGNS